MIFLMSIFGFALAVPIYSYAVYPFLIQWLASRTTRSNVSLGPFDNNHLPTVTIIVAAYNEELHIAARIQNLLAQDYPAERMTIFVGSDGSSDRTVEIARNCTDSRVKVLAFDINRGKSSVLNDCVAQATSEVLVFTDANTVFMPDTVRQLVSAIDDRNAVACGELILQAPEQGHNQDHNYWGIERRLKAAESSIGGLIGANGGVYAIKRESFHPLRADTICDDFIIAMNIATAGKGLRYVSTAVAHEDTPGDVRVEYHRRVRIGIGNYQALFRHPEYLLASPIALRFTYLSHKVLRWLTPHFLLIAFTCSVMLAQASPFFLVIALLQLVGYSIAVFIFFTRNQLPWPGLFRSAMFFAVLNFAFLVGFKRYLFADYRGSWRRTERK